MVDFFGFAPSKINKTGGACPLLSLVLQYVIQQITHETIQNKIKDILAIWRAVKPTKLLFTYDIRN